MFAQEGARKRYKGYSIEVIAARNGYVVGYNEGYEQAKQDTALIWEDIKAIVQIADSMLTPDTNDCIDHFGNEQTYYKEVLKRFNKQRK